MIAACQKRADRWMLLGLLCFVLGIAAAVADIVPPSAMFIPSAVCFGMAGKHRAEGRGHHPWVGFLLGLLLFPVLGVILTSLLPDRNA